MPRYDEKHGRLDLRGKQDAFFRARLEIQAIIQEWPPVPPRYAF